MNLYNNNNEKLTDDQKIFDSYNYFLMSNDKNAFNKMVFRINLYNQVKHLNGDVVECGVFKGAGLFMWLKLINLYEIHGIKKVIGFDFFDSSFVNEIIDTVDRETMKQVFTRCDDLSTDDISIDGITNRLLNSGFNRDKFELIKGDISLTSKEYIKDKPGFRISLLYLDLDLEQPTTDTLNIMWDRVVNGGIVVFDEYAYHKWSESNAVDKFLKDKDIKLINTNIKSPTAYIIKGKHD